MSLYQHMLVFYAVMATIATLITFLSQRISCRFGR